MKFKTWCLSLESNTDRREWMLSIKDKIGLDFEFWNATMADEITDLHKEMYFQNVNFYEWDIIAEAAMATFLSHRNILKWVVFNNTPAIIIEDDIDIVRPFDWDTLNFNSFDVYKLGIQGINCYSYAVSVEGADKLLRYFNNNVITEAYDLELHKIQNIRMRYLLKEVFVQIPNRFKSNIAPNGYKKIRNGNRNKKLH